MNLLVLGLGMSGYSAAKLGGQLGASLRLFDSRPVTSEEVEEHLGVKTPFMLVTGKVTPDFLLNGDLCVISPGVSPEDPAALAVKEAGIPIISELEWGYRHARGKLAAITGTNGKTTTTTLVGDIFRAWNPDTHVVGNIGNPYAAEALETSDTSLTVAEVSSFMLEAVESFHPQVSAILNITPDHLNRHGTMERYIAAKEAIATCQGAEDTCVLNYRDSVLRDFGETLKKKTQVLYFCAQHPLEEGVYIENGMIRARYKGENYLFGSTSDLILLGEHNYENVCAAIAISLAVGVPVPVIQNIVWHFQGVEHRIEYVATKQGVRYYNDSKGTNPDAAIQAIKAMPGPTVLLGGGYDKEADFGEWISLFPGKVKALLLMGATRYKIAKACNAIHFQNYQYVDSMEEAVMIAASLAEPGDYVLLSPACASWGMFKNYEERGKLFKEYVRAL